MTINLNQATVQGYVVGVYENDNNTKVTLVVRDDYRDRDGDLIERPYFLPITFFGTQAENLAKLVEKGSFLTVTLRVTSYKPDDEEYHTLSLVGERFYLTPRTNQESSSDTPQERPKRNSKSSSKRQPKKQAPVDDWDDDDDTEEEVPW